MRFKCEHGNHGFTLIELMVALVFLTTGLLGIAAMQDIAMSRNIDARRLTVATNIATEMIERIRFNSPLNANPLFAPAVPASPYLYHGLVACAAVPPANCPGRVVAATSGNAAGTLPANGTALGDYQQWQAHLIALDTAGNPLLPNGFGTVTAVPFGPAALSQVQVDVTVQWTSGFRTPTVTMSTIVSPL
jgi:prepilin-type N-terminal cleavage/methylation domain-containing protein